MQGFQEISPLLHQLLLFKGAQALLPQDSAATMVIPERTTVGIPLSSFVGVALINGFEEGQSIRIAQSSLAEVMTAVDSGDAEVSAQLCQGEPDLVAA